MAEGQIKVKLPNHMTLEELVASGKTLVQAKQIMSERVFGKDFKSDKDGNPIEQGIGSEANPFKATHLAALEKAVQMRVAHSGANPQMIAEIVAATLAALDQRKNMEL